MRPLALLAGSVIGVGLFFSTSFLTVEPLVRRVASGQSQTQSPLPLLPATQTPLPTSPPTDTPTPQVTIANTGNIPLSGPETAGATIEVGPPEARISITLPMNFELVGSIICSLCIYPHEFIQFCLDGSWVITDGAYWIYVRGDSGLILPEVEAFKKDPHYLERFQWLIDRLGADKLVDVLWLDEQMRNGWPTLTPVAPTAAPEQVNASASAYQLFLPMIAEP